VLRVDRRNIKRATKRRQLLHSFGVAFWTSHQHVKRSNILSKLTKNLIFHGGIPRQQSHLIARMLYGGKLE